MSRIDNLVAQKKYKEAVEVVESIDWRRVKNVHNLCVVGEIYAANKRYEESKEIFLLAYHRAPIGKNILYRLIEVSLKMQDIEEAEEFYEEYLEVAPNDNTQYILKYKISKAKQVSLDEQIRILEEYKEREFTERWSYELAKLYYQKGDMKKCLEMCNDIILWFSEGRYVLKAMDLKNRMGQLTGKEREQYEKQFIPNLTTVDQMTQSGEARETGSDAENKYEALPDEDSPVIESVRIDERDVNSAESLQEKISKGIRDIFNGKKKEEDFTKEEEDLQEEMLRDRFSEKEHKNVPELEPEEVSVLQEEENISQDSFAETEEAEEPEIDVNEIFEDFSDQTVSRLEEEETLSDSSTELPQLEIPESMKNIDLESDIMPEIPKAPEVVLPGAEKNETEAEIDFDFNLEDMILSAATAQGIEIPDDEPKAEDVHAADPDDEDYMTEEDLRRAEEEFLNGPAGRKDHKDPEELLEEEFGEADEFYEDASDDEDDDFYGDEYDDGDDDFYGEESDDEDDDFYEDESDDGDDFYEEFDDDDFYGEESDDEEDDFYEEEPEELPVVSRNPISKNKSAKIISEEKNAEIRKPDPDRKTVFKEEPAGQKAPRKKKNVRLSQAEELERFVDTIRPQEAMDIIPREKTLTDSEKKLFTYFARVPGLREQLVDALCDVQMAAADKTSRTGNIIVMGGRETGKTRLISGLIPAICKELNLEAAKVAYVFAEQINGKNIPAIVKKMAGGFLVIENANQLKKETVNQLSKAMDFRTDGMIVILEDEKIGMRKLMARFPKFTSKFTSMINIPVFTNDELVNFAMVYTRERGYTIDQQAMLVLYNLISVNQKEDMPMNVGAVKEIIDNAIAKSTGGIRKLSRNISKKRTDMDGYTVLYEKDFK
ncbi:hypothetical protein ABID24_002407 [Blautia caecimuris]|uniref:Tetratricopeptide repeat protein n=1 Tax=Blautia caecimuris TaxID=1796615 RepID=A0ABV2M437_9FIRM|nr:hypothetical protein [uncultured Blautia sp.]MCR2002629.1 hypothetical protein [Blautia caecimuris]